MYFKLIVDETQLIVHDAKEKDEEGNPKLKHYLQTLDTEKLEFRFEVKVSVDYLMIILDKAFYLPINVAAVKHHEIVASQ